MLLICLAPKADEYILFFYGSLNTNFLSGFDLYVREIDGGVSMRLKNEDKQKKTTGGEI